MKKFWFFGICLISSCFGHNVSDKEIQNYLEFLKSNPEVAEQGVPRKGKLSLFSILKKSKMRQIEQIEKWEWSFKTPIGRGSNDPVIFPSGKYHLRAHYPHESFHGRAGYGSFAGLQIGAWCQLRFIAMRRDLENRSCRGAGSGAGETLEEAEKGKL